MAVRAFLAAWPSAEAVAALAALPRPPGDRIRWVPPERWHVTLRFLGDVEVGAVVAAVDGSGLAALAPPVAVLGPTVQRLGEDVVCVPVSGLDDLAARMRAATAGAGGPPERRPFTGHLTLGRLRRGAVAPAELAVATTFEVRAVDLVLSERVPERSGRALRYRTVHRWRLGPDGGNA